MRYKMDPTKKAYEGYENCSGLRLLTPQGLKLRSKILDCWRRVILNPLDAKEIKTPCIIPNLILKNSGHESNFKEELFYLDSNLALRPQTAQSIFSNYKILRREFKGNPLAIAQVGLSFRNERTSRSSTLRLKEFEQMEVQTFYEKSIEKELYQKILTLVQNFFKELGLEVTSEEILGEALPHYSLKTIDFFAEDVKKTLWEVGCLNLRGNHDLRDQAPGVQVIEISLGLNRIIQLLGLSKN